MTPRTHNETDSSAEISIVIPVHNGGQDFRACLESVVAAMDSRCELIVVDDASTDDSANVARELGARVIQLTTCHGPAYARNRGAELAHGQILFFTDADVCVHQDTIQVAAEVLHGSPELAAVIGSYDDAPGNPTFLSQFKNLFHHWVHQSSHDEASTFWTGCGAIRRQVFLSIGGFNEGYGKPSIEDIELGFRLRLRKQPIRLEKRLLAKHMKRWRFWNLLQTDIFRRGAPWIALMMRDRYAPKDLNLSNESKIGTVLAGLLAAALLILPLVGQAMATLPTIALLLATWLCAALIESKGERTWRTPLAIGVCLAAVAATISVQPNAWFALPFLIWFGIVWSHRDFYRYIWEKRGAVFALASSPMHIIFQLSCGISVPFGILDHVRNTRRARRQSEGPAVRDLRPLNVPRSNGAA